MIFGDVVVGDTGQPERWRDVAGVAITTFPIVSRFLDIKEVKPVLDTVWDYMRDAPGRLGVTAPVVFSPAQCATTERRWQIADLTKLRRIIYGRVLFLMFHTFWRRNGH